MAACAALGSVDLLAFERIKPVQIHLRPCSHLVKKQQVVRLPNVGDFGFIDAFDSLRGVGDPDHTSFSLAKKTPLRPLLFRVHSGRPLRRQRRDSPILRSRSRI